MPTTPLRWVSAVSLLLLASPVTVAAFAGSCPQSLGNTPRSLRQAVERPHGPRRLQQPRAVLPLHALVYGTDGKRIPDRNEGLDANYYHTVLERNQEAEILAFLAQPHLKGPLAVIAAARGALETALIQEVRVVSVSLDAISMAAMTSCDRDSHHLVNVLVEVPFPTACRASRWKHDLVAHLGALHADAQRIVDEQLERAKHHEQARAADRRIQALSDPVEDYPSWWEAARGDALSQECAVLRTLLNQPAASRSTELLALVRRYQGLAHQEAAARPVQHVAVAEVGAAGMMLRATDGATMVQVPVRFSTPATDATTLRQIVLDLVEGVVGERASAPRNLRTVSAPDREGGTELRAKAGMPFPETKVSTDLPAGPEDHAALVAPAEEMPTDEVGTAASPEKLPTKRKEPVLRSINNSDVQDPSETPTMAKLQAWKNSLWGRPSKRFTRRHRRKKLQETRKRQ
jgi:hypothetical protein